MGNSFRGNPERDAELLTQLVNRYGVDAMHNAVRAIEQKSVALVRQTMTLALKPTAMLEIMERLETQYINALEVWIQAQVDIQKAPAWGTVKSKLAMEHLPALAEVEQPLVVLVPPLAEKQVVKVIDQQKGKYGIAYRTHVDKRLIDSDSATPKERLAWEVIIIEGKEEIELNKELQTKDGDFLKNHEQIKALYHNLKAKGLEPINGIRSYLAAMITALANNEPFDIQNWTVINPTAVIANPTLPISFGCWSNNWISLYKGNPENARDNLRLRGMIKVNV